MTIEHTAARPRAVATPPGATPLPADPILAIEDLHVVADSGAELVRGISLQVQRGSTLGIVGESGSGKSLTCRAALGILPVGTRLARGRIRIDGIDVTDLTFEQWRPLRGPSIAAVFQDPGSYLNPSIAVGRQLVEVLRVKARLPRRAARDRAVELFARMGLRDPGTVFDQYPFELSGGMLQRVLLAIALAEDPALLIADEATTALDVNVQAEVLDLLDELKEERGISLVLVSHDLAVVAQVCDTVAVMRDGEVVEHGAAGDVLGDPRHDYTRLLVDQHRRYGLERFLASETSDA
jgi:ABC-type dipeptide/oligopeptide/nickel transport system ATPase component